MSHEISSWTLEEKFHTSARPSIILHITQCVILSGVVDIGGHLFTKHRRTMMRLSYENNLNLRFADQVNKGLIHFSANVDENAL